MKIKRFEASNMSEALRMIKKEFGEEAVILSAKTMKKPGRLLGLGAASQVVVTAATDQEVEQTADKGLDRTVARRVLQDQDSSSWGQDDPEADQTPTGERPRTGIGRILQRFTPITRTGLNKLQPKIVQLMNQTPETREAIPKRAPRNSFYEMLLEQGIDRPVAMELSGRMDELAPAHTQGDDEIVALLAQIIEAKGWVAQRMKRVDGRRIMAFVGPCGAGKTSMVAKMAAQASMQAGTRVGIISLDNQRIAGSVELEKYAGIMALPFETAADEQQLDQALQRLDTVELILVDTPGLGPHDQARRDALSQRLQRLNAVEIHLLLPAGAQEQVMTKTIEFFTPLGITRLLPTHLDWCRQLGPLVNQVDLNRLPVGYLGMGAQIPEGLQMLTAGLLAAMLLSQEDTMGIQDSADEPVTIVEARFSEQTSGEYVANRNSDIFHHYQCKAVHRISDSHILNFKDSQQALDQGFKPCRMCCMALFAPKPIDRPARYRVAGFRN
jgi:flagellar biosynthetic protein FlhF